MYSGWMVKFPINRQIDETEREASLSREKKLEIEPDDRSTLISFNSVYADFIDRRFKLRGSLPIIMATLWGAGSIILGAYMWIAIPTHQNGYLISNITITAFCIFITWLLWKFVIGRDFVTYTHFPVRFNRKTKKIYVFRDKRDGGTLILPWDDGLFHIGRGIRAKNLRDLRCHVMDGDVVKDTFTVGHFFTRDLPVQEIWEFIRRYMDEGPQAVNPSMISMSAAPTWTNCYIMASASLNAGSALSRALLSPLLLLLTFSRWLVLKTCKTPKWPSEVEAECTRDIDDPFALREPTYIGEEYNYNEKAYTKRMEKIYKDQSSKKNN